MTHQRPEPDGVDAPADPTPALSTYLSAYRPKQLEPEVWSAVADDCAALVLSAGAPTHQRVKKDIAVIASVMTHLVERGRPLTLDEALSDTTLSTFDSQLNVRAGTRENVRGVIRRLQATHRGLPWHRARRPDAQRIDALVPYTEVGDLERIMTLARDMPTHDAPAVALTSAVDAARADRRDATRAGAGAGAFAAIGTNQWADARQFSARHGLDLTRAKLRAIVTHEVLAQEAPLAVLVATFALTRRDLDLALTQLADLPAVPDSDHQRSLRGRC